MNENLSLPKALLLLIVALSSCRQALYVPDRANTPGLTEALEAKATFSIRPNTKGSSSSYNNGKSSNSNSGGTGTSIDLAFSPIKHIGLMGSYRSLRLNTVRNYQDSISSRTETTTQKGNRWELGCGYYNNIGAKSYVELYAGYSNGFYSQVNNTSAVNNFDTKYLRPFIQPSVGFKIGRRILLTGGIRATIVKFYNFNNVDSMLRYTIGNANHDIEKTTYFFFEPFCNFEGGYKYINGNVQIGWAQQYNNANITGGMPFYISLGISLHFTPSFLKNKR